MSNNFRTVIRIVVIYAKEDQESKEKLKFTSTDQCLQNETLSEPLHNNTKMGHN